MLFVGVTEQKNSFRIRMMLQIELQQVVVTWQDLDINPCCTSLTMMLLILVGISHHNQGICVSMTILNVNHIFIRQILKVHFSDLLVCIFVQW